ncbi:MAG: hypothetical protein PHY47_01340 [Lachnospiraceae bacterium]|nr:hypothetical protein [Lachnospiraceae bacterium]
MTMTMTTKYNEALKRKEALEAELASLTEQIEAVEATQNEEKITVENTGTGVLLGFRTATDERREIFLTPDEVASLVFDLATNTPNAKALANPFQVEIDKLYKAFFR